MADTTNLTNFLQDVADAIKEKKEYESSQKILAADFDTEIASIETGIDTSDATATASDILAPKTAYVNEQKITGNIVPSYGASVPKPLQTPITWNSSINLWDISYSKKIAVINSGNTGFGLVKIINNSIDYTTRVDLTRDDIGVTYTITDCKISATNDNTIVLWILGKAGGGDDYYRTNYHSVTRCILNYSDLSIISYKTEYYTFGSHFTNSYCLLPRPNSNIDVAVIISFNGRPNINIGVRLYRYDSQTDSFLTKLDYQVKYEESTLYPNAPWGYWTDDGNYLLGHSYKPGHNSRCVIHKVNQDAGCTLLYSSGTQRRILNGGYYLQGTTIYSENGTAVGTSVVNFSSNTTNLSILYPLIFIRNSNNSTALYQLTDEYNIIKIQDLPTNSNKAFTTANSAYLYDSGGQLSGYSAELEPDIIGMRRNNIDYLKLYQATGEYGDVLSGKKVYNNNGLIVGTMPNNGAINIAPSDTVQTIPAGYTSGGTVAAISNQIKTIAPTTDQQIVIPDTGYNGLGQVNVSAVDNTIDNNIQANNIKKDVTILGVTGTYEGEPSLYNTITNPVISEHGYGEISSVLKNITELPDLDLVTNNVTSMEDAFMNFRGLTKLPNFNTSNLTNVSNMCGNCISLTSAPALNLPNCTTLYGIFSGCTSLLNVGDITTGTQLGDVRRMFYGCTALTSAPTISNTSNVAQAHSMFEGCSSLEDVPVYNFYNTTSGGLQNIFKNCTSLTNESLNNILAMCINTWRQTSDYKTLQYIGLTETQANTCKTLSNWADFESAGWSTGY